MGRHLCSKSPNVHARSSPRLGTACRRFVLQCRSFRRHLRTGHNVVLDQITPALLTYNEEPNIGRTLARLAWARDVVVVDSGSTDRTLEILRKFRNVRVFQRNFDTHANQWRFATENTGIATEWVLRLDADYQVSDALVAEIAQLDPNAAVNGYRISFNYAIFSRELSSSLYPPKTVLLRKGQFAVWDKGHTEAWEVNGPIVPLSARIVHDDRKPVGHWMAQQARYMRRELDRLKIEGSGLARWARLKPPLMPFAVFFYCLFAKGLIFNGRYGIFYALQRMLAEAVLALMVLEERVRSPTEQDFDPNLRNENKH
jgi:glycosyltransferase involved in cell wall biosynthesis